MEKVSKVVAVNQTNRLKATFRICWNGKQDAGASTVDIDPGDHVEVPIPKGPNGVAPGTPIQPEATLLWRNNYYGTNDIVYDPTSNVTAIFYLSGSWRNATLKLAESTDEWAPTKETEAAWRRNGSQSMQGALALQA